MYFRGDVIQCGHMIILLILIAFGALFVFGFLMLAAAMALVSAFRWMGRRIKSLSQG